MKHLKNLNKQQLLKLLAILALSDGHIFKRGTIPKNLRLVTSFYGEAQHHLFRILCQKIFSKNVRKRITFNALTSQKFILSDFNFGKDILTLYALSPEYKTTPGKQKTEDFLKAPQPTLNFLFGEDDALKWMGLRTYFDFDGSISPTIKLKYKKDKKKAKIYDYFQVQLECEIKISETNPSLVNDLVHLCTQLGLKAVIKRDNRNWSGLAGICISEIESVKKFLKLGGPITEVKISGKSNRFKGITKMEICRRLNQIFSDQSFKFSKSFNTLNGAIIYQKDSNKILSRHLTK